jgi:hypothetical protein
MPRKSVIGATRESAVYRLRVPAPLKAQWDQHCDKQDVTPSVALRALMTYLIKDDIPPEVRRWIEHDGAPDYGPKERLEVRFTPSEFEALTARAQAEGSSPQRWVANSVRASLTHQPQFTMETTRALWESSRQLQAIGRNLNQIAKRLNQDEPGTVKTEQLDKLTDYVHSHTKKVGALLDASLSRWTLKSKNDCGSEKT